MPETKRTPGEWEVYDQAVDDGPEYGCSVRSKTDENSDWIATEIHNRADAHLIASIPTLQARIDRLEAENDEITESSEQVISQLKDEKAELLKIAVEALSWWHAEGPEFIRLAHESEIAREAIIAKTEPKPRV